MKAKKALAVIMAFALVFSLSAPIPVGADYSAPADTAEIAAITAFLNESSDGGITNAEVLGCDAETPGEWSSFLSFSESSGKITAVFFSELPLNGSLDLSGFSELSSLYIYSAGIEAVTLGQCSALLCVDIENAPITALSLSDCTALTSLCIVNTGITSLSLTANTSLTEVIIRDTPISGSFSYPSLTLETLELTDTNLTAINTVIVRPNTTQCVINTVSTADSCIGITAAARYDEASQQSEYINLFTAYPARGRYISGWRNTVTNDVTVADSDLFDFSALTSLTLAPVLSDIVYNTADVAIIRAILAQTDGSRTNYEKLDITASTPVSGWVFAEFDRDGRATAFHTDNVSALSGGCDVSGLTALRGLSICGTGFTSVTTAGCTALEYVNCSGLSLNSLDLSSCTALVTLICDFTRSLENRLLLPTGATNFIHLQASDCALTSLTLPASTQFAFLRNNALTSLTLTGLTSLRVLDVTNNQLTSLDASGHSSLASLSCSYNNSLSTLNIGNCPALRCLYIESTQLSGSLNYTANTFDVLRYEGSSVNSITFNGNVNGQTRSVSFSSDTHSHISKVIFGNEYNESTQSDRAAFYAVCAADSGYMFAGWYNNITSAAVTDAESKIDYKSLLSTGNVSLTASSTTLVPDTAESAIIAAFLNQTDSSNVSNAEKLSVDASDPLSWDFVTRDDKYISEISLNEYGLALCGEADFSGLSRLTRFELKDSDITAVNISSCPKLRDVNCWDNLSAASLNVSGSVNIENLSFGNSSVTAVDVAGFTSLRSLNLSGTLVSELDIAGCTALSEVRLLNTALSSFFFLEHPLNTLSVGNSNIGLTSINAKLNKSNSSVCEFDISAASGCDALISEFVIGDEWDDSLQQSVYMCYALATTASDTTAVTYWENGALSTSVSSSDYISLEELFLASSALTLKIHSAAVTDDETENAKLAAFFAAADSGGNTNAFKLGIADSSDSSLWYSYVTRSRGHVTSIDFGSAQLDDYEIKLVGTLDLSGFTKLESVYCDNAGFTSLNVSSCPKLRTVSANNTGLSALNIAGSDNIEELSISNNGLTAIDVSGLTHLRHLEVSYNRELSSLDISGCTSLAFLGMDNVALTGDLDTTDCVLRMMRAYDIHLDSITMRGYLENDEKQITVDAGDNLLITSFAFGSVWNNDEQMDIDTFTVEADGRTGYAFDLWTDGNSVTYSTECLDFSQLLSGSTLSLTASSRTAVMNAGEISAVATFLAISDGTRTNGEKLGMNPADTATWSSRIVFGAENIKEIDFSQENVSDELRITGALDLSGFAKLEKVNCYNTSVTSLNLNNCPSLTDVNVWFATLSTLTFENCPKLKHLDCLHNNITSLNLVNVPCLKNLKISENQITSFNGADLEFEWFESIGNPLTSLCVKVKNNIGDVYTVSLTGSEHIAVGLSFNSADTVKLIAAPAHGYKITSWVADDINGDIDDPTRECELYLDTDRSFTASEGNNPLSYICASSTPDRLSYTAGQHISLDGLRVEAVYEDGSTYEVFDYTVSFNNGDVLSIADNGSPITIEWGGKSEYAGDLIVEPMCSAPANNGIVCRGLDLNASVLKDNLVAAGSAASVDKVSIKEGSNTEEYTGVLKSGLTVTITDGSNNKTSFTLCVIGDIYGDGNISSDDFTYILNASVGSLASGVPDSAQTAADLNGDGVIDSLDAMMAELAVNNGYRP